jgi:hypothetical protein
VDVAVRFVSTLVKLQPMKDHWAPRTGVAIHVVVYTIVPIVFGVVTVFSGLADGSLF